MHGYNVHVCSFQTLREETPDMWGYVNHTNNLKQQIQLQQNKSIPNGVHIMQHILQIYSKIKSRQRNDFLISFFE